VVSGLTIDRVLADISIHLQLSKECENEVLTEIRTHLEDAVADAAVRGGDEQTALMKTAEQFGVDETGAALQEVHANWGTIDAIIGTALPVLFALLLRWLVFAPDGSAVHWPQLLTQPGFYLAAVTALVIPLLAFRRWRFALVGWGLFWLLSVIFIIFPNISRW
jgi:hypothetical protein